MNQQPLGPVPVIRELRPEWTPQVCWQRLGNFAHPILLESALTRAELGRFSFLAVDPVAWYEDRQWPVSNLTPGQPWLPIPDDWPRWQSAAVPGLPPFQGGLAGWMSYELAHRFERLPQVPYRPFDLPLQAWGLYDVVLAWDHQLLKGWLISQGLPEFDATRRLQRAAERLEFFWQQLESTTLAGGVDADQPSVDHAWASPSLAQLFSPENLPFAPQYSVPQLPLVTSNFTRDGYLAAVAKAREYIVAGDIFQVNLSQQLLTPQTCTSRELYQRLSRLNPATFAGYFDLGETQIISASPERLLRCQAGWLETRPIKGTRKRCGDPALDQISSDELQHSPKDRAENIMIVDLMRNDLSRVCLDDSIRVTQLCQPEFYETVIHLVSAVTGQLRDELNPADWLAAVFPGGSVTGAPKIRSMEIISELEQTARGAYCGSLGYLSVTGEADFNLLIRTITAHRGWWQFPVGGAIVSDSDPELEWEETWTKAQGLLNALARQRQTTVWR